MLTPSTFVAALLLLLLSAVAFASWPHLYKASQTRWRFELFALDFGCGMIAFSLLAAYTAGTLGPEISFTDRMLIAGGVSAIWVAAAGVVLALGILTLLPSITLLGLAPAFSIAFGIAGIGLSISHLKSPHIAALALGIAFLLACVACGILAARTMRSAGRPKSVKKGTILAVIAGISLGTVQPVLRFIGDPEFGPGPYGSVLVLGLGMLLATPAIDFFLMHIKIVGTPISFRVYRLGGWRPHWAGFRSGCFFALGLLTLLLAVSSTAPAHMVNDVSVLGDSLLDPPWTLVLPCSAVAATILLGLYRWHEFSAATRPRTLLLASATCFLLGIAAIGYAWTP